MTTREDVAAWLQGYERAWRAPGTAAVRGLFTEDASYQTSPYSDPVVGLDGIAALWERERDGPDEQFTMDADVVVFDGDTAVLRVEVRYAGPPPREYRDLWIVRFDQAGRCRMFEEWPFWPGQPLTAPSELPRA